MAGGGGPPIPEGGGGKKTVDFQLNLIPCIDLLSVLISFLLFTSVWTQVAKIDVKQNPNQADSEPQPDQDDKLNLTVLIKGNGYTVSTKTGVVKEIERKGESYDVQTLKDTLKQMRNEHPENEDIQVTCEDKIPYEELIAVMDTCLENDLKGISVAGVDG